MFRFLKKKLHIVYIKMSHEWMAVYLLYKKCGCSLIICSNIVCCYWKRTMTIRSCHCFPETTWLLEIFVLEDYVQLLTVYPMRRVKPLQSHKNKQNKDYFLNCGHREICNHLSLKGSLSWHTINSQASILWIQ